MKNCDIPGLGIRTENANMALFLALAYQAPLHRATLHRGFE
jgi:hypothetical protein